MASILLAMLVVGVVAAILAVAQHAFSLSISILFDVLSGGSSFVSVAIAYIVIPSLIFEWLGGQLGALHFFIGYLLLFYLLLLILERWQEYKLLSLAVFMATLGIFSVFFELLILADNVLLIVVTGLMSLGLYLYYVVAHETLLVGFAEHVRRRYGQLQKKHASDVEQALKGHSQMENTVSLSTVLFSIMAIEDMNRPRVIRLLENVAQLRLKRLTTGIMQMRSDQVLSDPESINLAAQKICAVAADSTETRDAILKKIANDYNGASEYVEDLRVAYGAIESLSAKRRA